MPPSSIPSDPNALPATVERTLTAHRMLAPGDRVLVGVSGGPDSMALLHLLSRMAAELKIRLGVAHLNHCLRGASADRDAKVVRQAAAALNHPFHTVRAHVLKVKRQLGLSLEEAARRVRYAFFKKIMRTDAYNKLALGHHMGDNAEQMLMVLLRGTGPRGLSGIAPVRDGWIVRPLINTRRSAIEAYVKAQGITCVQDASNNDQRFVRNRIRHQLLPLLASAYNPRIEEHLNRLADVMRTEAAWTDGLAVNPYEMAVLNRESGAITLRIAVLCQSHPALARRMVRMALQDLTGSLQRIGFTHVQAVLRLLTDGSDGKQCHLPGGIRARRIGDRLMLFLSQGRRRGVPAATTEDADPVNTIIGGPFPATVEIGSMGMGLRFALCGRHQLSAWDKVDRKQAFLDLDRVVLPLIVRPPIPGDRFTPLGAPGSQKVKKFFIDHHISRADRVGVPVLADTKGIVWLVGRRIDERVKVTSQTTQILRIEFFLLDIR